MATVSAPGGMLSGVLVAVLSGALSACASSCDRNGDAAVDAATAATDSGAERGPRCVGPSSQRALADVTEVGQAVLVGHEVLIGVVLVLDAGRVHQGVVITDDTLSQVTVKDLGEGIPDGPIPRPFIGGGDAYVAFHPGLSRRSSDGDGGATRGLVLRAQKVHDDPRSVVDFARGPTGTFGFDVAFAGGSIVAAWEEDVERRGVIRVARAGKGGIVVSPATTDADDPKLLPLPDGRLVVAWTGMRDEPTDAGHEHDLERPSEDRAFRWAEVAFLEPDKLDPELTKPLADGGAPKKSFVAYRATPENGHVGSLELALSRGAPMAFIQDEGAEADGAGGRILSLVLGPAQPRDSRVVVPRGVGHALFDYLPISTPSSPSSLAGDASTGSEGPAFVSFADVAEHQMLAVVGQAAPDSLPTTEPTMELGRPLVALSAAGADPRERRILALKVPGATPNRTSPSAELWLLTCVP